MVVRVRERERLRQVLAENGVGTGIHYPTPCHLMTPYAAYADGPLPVAERASDEVLSLPLYPSLGLADVERVAAMVNEAAAGSLVA
jgi:dTDP-4-amino-4,6-dideoxygalactose transaminase